MDEKMKAKGTLLPLRRPSPAASDQPRSVPSGGALSKPIPVRHPEWGAARPAGVGGQARPARPLILGGGVAGLLLAGGGLNALAATFTNGDFTSYGQFDWASTPAAVAILDDNYNTVFASTSGVLELGNPTRFTMSFTSAAALAGYLPDVGPIGALDADLANPTSSPSGAFGGDVAALKLNIDFSDAGLLGGNGTNHFGDLVLHNFGETQRGVPGLNLKTVRAFSTIVNNVLGGGGNYGHYTPADLDSITASINSSYLNGAASAFATNNLALP